MFLHFELDLSFTIISFFTRRYDPILYLIQVIENIKID
jgi:hypothetical protein